MNRQKIMSSLEADKHKLMEEIEAKKRLLKNQAEIHSDSADESIDEIENKELLSDILRDEKRLRKFELAELAVEAGDYGFCKKCHKKISEKRLAAVPEAILCINCSEA